MIDRHRQKGFGTQAGENRNPIKESSSSSWKNMTRGEKRSRVSVVAQEHLLWCTFRKFSNLYFLPQRLQLNVVSSRVSSGFCSLFSFSLILASTSALSSFSNLYF